MKDPRDEQYARLLVETCIDVQPGWQVLVLSNVLGRPLYDEVVKVIAERGAYVLSRVSFAAFGAPGEWVKNASDELLSSPAPLEENTMLHADAMLAIIAPENTRELSDVEPRRLQLMQKGSEKIQARWISGDVPWVGCQYPTPALAQDAGMTLNQFAEFLYGAVLLDWDAERERMQKMKELFDAADEVRIVGEGTDLRIGLSGREGKVDAAGANIPGGEVFYSPVEDSAEGEIVFSEFPAVFAGREMSNIRFRFEGGRVVDAGASSNEEFLLETIDVDEGARRLVGRETAPRRRLGRHRRRRARRGAEPPRRRLARRLRARSRHGRERSAGSRNRRRRRRRRLHGRRQHEPRDRPGGTEAIRHPVRRRPRARPGARRLLRRARTAHRVSDQDRDRRPHRGRAFLRGPARGEGLVPHPAIHIGLSPAITRRAAASSVAPIATAIDAPCVLASLGASDRETRQHYRKGH